jgi:hypothetical protein
MQKTDLKTSTRKAQTHNFSKQVRRLRVFLQRLRGPEVPRFCPEAPRPGGSAFFTEPLRCPETAARTKEEWVKTRSKQLGLTWNFAGRILGVLRRYLQDINIKFQAYHEKSKKNEKAPVLET